ncbi:MAG: hypothetical protein JNK15_18885 [Planctomycetes bacterium]|nr:hypothetical protein [Planctomycetota bacterium]
MQATLVRSLVAAAIGVPLFAQAPNKMPQTAEAMLPASTYAAARFGGLAACRDATMALPLAPAVQAFLAKIPAEVRQQWLEDRLDQAAGELQQQLQHAGLRPADVRGFLARPMTLAVGRLSIEGMGPSVALVVEVGEQRQAVNRMVQWGAGLVEQLAEGTQRGEVDIGGHKFHTLASPETPTLFAGSLGDRYYVVSNSRGYVRDMIDVVAGKQASLVGSTRLVQLNAMLPAPALASWFLNTERVLSAFAPHMPYETEDWCRALGVGALDGVWAGYTANAEGGADVLHLGLQGDEKGLLKALVAAPADLSFARACSANTVAFASMSWDVPAVLDAFHRFAGLLPPAVRDEMLREAGRELGRELRHLGTLPQLDETLRAFGSQFAFALALEKGAVPKPELLARIAVRDGEKVLGLLQKFEALVAREAEVEWKTRKADGHEVRFCNVPLPQAELQLSPCYVLTQDALWFGSDVAALVRALRQTEDECLAAQPDFQAAVKTAKDASGLVFLRWSRAAEIGWRTIETMAYPQLDAHKDEVGFGSEALPDAETMAKALGTSTMTWRVGDDGITLESRGTFTYGSLLALLGMGFDEVLGRAGGKVY